MAGLHYEALDAEILAAFVTTFDPSLEQAWTAEVDGTMAGSIFLMRSSSPGIAKLRLLYVEPGTRGMGIGGKLVDVGIGRARAVGDRKLERWTNSVLVSARRTTKPPAFDSPRSLRIARPARIWSAKSGPGSWPEPKLAGSPIASKAALQPSLSRSGFSG